MGLWQLAQLVLKDINTTPRQASAANGLINSILSFIHFYFCKEGFCSGRLCMKENGGDAQDNGKR